MQTKKDRTKKGNKYMVKKTTDKQRKTRRGKKHADKEMRNKETNR